MSLSDKAERDEIAWDILDVHTGFVNYGEMLMGEITKAREAPIKIIDEMINTLNVVFSDKFQSRIDNICTVVTEPPLPKPITDPNSNHKRGGNLAESPSRLTNPRMAGFLTLLSPFSSFTHFILSPQHHYIHKMHLLPQWIYQSRDSQ
jgi:hypothetical protein